MARSFLAVLTTVAVALSAPAQAADVRARDLVRAALSAQGGESKLRALHSVEWKAVGYRNELEQSERAEGPYVTQFNEVREVHDLAGRQYFSSQQTTVYPAARVTNTLVVAHDVAARSIWSGAAMPSTPPAWQPGTPLQVQVARERMALSPERLLITALDASDLSVGTDTLVHAVPHHVVSFTLDGAPVSVYLNAYTRLPTAVTYTGPLAQSGFWGFLGDATMRTTYSMWWIAKDGIRFPLQQNVEVNGVQDNMLAIKTVAIDEPLAAADFAIPDDVRAHFNQVPAPTLEDRPLGMPGQPARELAPGIVFIPGAWNVTLVHQEDGVVVLEAPISSGYSAKVLAQVAERFPGSPIKAVITTSDAWPHLAGIREYVARGIPIYALDLNEPIVRRVVAEQRSSKPDLLHRAPREAEIRLVKDKVVIGSGKNRLAIYPIRGATSERQMMVYFPEHRMLYGSDPFQRNEDHTYSSPQAVGELTDAVAREHLPVQSFFMMHIDQTPWSDLIRSLTVASKGRSLESEL